MVRTRDFYLLIRVAKQECSDLNFQFKGKFDISINVRNTDGKPVENVLVVFPLGKTVSNVNATCNLGSYMFDPVTKVDPCQ